MHIGFSLYMGAVLLQGMFGLNLYVSIAATAILGAGVFVFAVIIAAFFSLITIAIGWIFYRPLLGIGLLVVAGGIVFAAKSMFAAKKPQAETFDATK